MNSDRIHKQIRSLLTRWGYERSDRSNEAFERYGIRGRSGGFWIYPPDVDIWGDLLRTTLIGISEAHGFSVTDIRRMIEAEPVDRDLGTIELHSQPLTEWGDREDHAEATIVMDARGRDRLIAALIEGRDSIEVYGESGGRVYFEFESKLGELKWQSR